jgi:pimeloyl-ACP methyl ester carboxylesterase
MGERNASVDGAALAYREQGEGEPVVFVHGSSSDLRTWERQLPAIGASYRAIAYSRRHARSTKTSSRARTTRCSRTCTTWSHSCG